MIRPIYVYGQPVLRKVTQDIDASFPDLQKLIDDMFDTMYSASGIGLAAPQIGLEDRIFVVDLSPLAEDNPEFENFKKVFINARIIERSETTDSCSEGCLSIPNIRENVIRPESIRIQYLDENLKPHDVEYSGFAARCIQHEYDHIEGILFTDHISPIRRRLISGKLKDMTRGNVKCDYRIKTLGHR